MVGRTPEELHELKEAFTTVYKVDLQEHTLSFCKDDQITSSFFINTLKVTLPRIHHSLGKAEVYTCALVLQIYHLTLLRVVHVYGTQK